jgi:WD40 repeat protein
MRQIQSESLTHAHLLSAVAVKFSSDGRFLASAGKYLPFVVGYCVVESAGFISCHCKGADKVCQVCDLSDKTVCRSMSEEHSLGLNDCVWLDGSQYLLTACDDGCLNAFDLETVSRLFLSCNLCDSLIHSLSRRKWCRLGGFPKRHPTRWQ